MSKSCQIVFVELFYCTLMLKSIGVFDLNDTRLQLQTYVTLNDESSTDVLNIIILLSKAMFYLSTNI